MTSQNRFVFFLSWCLFFVSTSVGSEVGNSQSVPAKRWADVEEAGRRSSSWLCVDVTPRANGSRTVKFKDEGGKTSLPERTLAIDEGVPLLQCSSSHLSNRGWSQAGTKPAFDERQLLRGKRETEVFKICKLSDFGTCIFERENDFIQSFDHRHVWSPDGNYLYVLSGRPDNKGWQTLRKIDTHSWQIEVEIHPSDYIADITYTAQGLVVCCDSMRDAWPEFHPKGATWLQVFPSNQQLQSYKGGVLLLDTDTLTARRGWVTPIVQEMAGQPTSDLIYLRSPPDALMTINVKTGELLSCYSFRDLLGDEWDAKIPQDLHFLNPRLSADGGSLTTHGMSNVVSTKFGEASQLGSRFVNRFRVSGPRIEWEQSRKVGGVRSRFTRRCDVGIGEDYLLFPGQRFEFVSVDSINRPVAKLSLPASTAMGMDSSSKTAFFCWPDWKSKQLSFRMIRGTTDLEASLENGIAPTTEASFRRSSFKSEFLVHQNLWPFEMSSAPGGKGAIVFTPDAAYWIEPKYGPEGKWAFNESKNVASNNLDPASIARKQAGVLTDCKSAMALIRSPSQDRFGSAFCIDKRGYFLTSASIVEGLELNSEVPLVVQAGSVHERATLATIVKSDLKARVALLKTQPHIDLVPLRLGDDSLLSEATPLTAFGFTYSPENDSVLGGYPSVSVKPGVATSLRKSGAELIAIQYSGELTAGNTGGPVVDSAGEVVGIIQSGIELLDINFLLPASQVTQLSWSELSPRNSSDLKVAEKRSEIDLAKEATVLVVLPEKRGFGTAFCVNERGFFATNAHVVDGVSEQELVLLVLHAGQDREQRIRAKVVRRIKEFDLALLEVVEAQDLKAQDLKAQDLKAQGMGEGFRALELENSNQLTEQMDVTALGFPLGDALRVGGNAFPGVSVNAATINAMKTTVLGKEAFEFRTQLNPGNSGGPVINKSGKVVGVVFATAMGQRKSYAISVSRLRELMFTPDITSRIPEKINFENRREEILLSIVATPYLRSLDGLEITLSLKQDYGPEKSYAMTATGANGSFEVLAPLVSVDIPDFVKATIEFATGSVTGFVADQEVHVGNRKSRLSTLTSEDSKSALEVLGLERLTIGTKKIKAILDCTKATGATITTYRPKAVAYTIMVNQDGREVLRRNGKIALVATEPETTNKFRLNEQIARTRSTEPTKSDVKLHKVTATFEDGEITGLVANRRFKVRNSSTPEEFELRQVINIRPADFTQVDATGNPVRAFWLNLQTSQASLLTTPGTLEGLEKVPFQIGENEILVDLSTAKQVVVEH